MTGFTEPIVEDCERFERRLRETGHRHDRLQTESICCVERLSRPIPHTSHEQNKTLVEPTLLLRPQAVCTWQRNRDAEAAGTLGITMFTETL